MTAGDVPQPATAISVKGNPTAAELAALLAVLETIANAGPEAPGGAGTGRLWGRTAPRGWVAAGRVALAGQASGLLY